ncbi:MAG: hypothetical protein KGJ34_01950 [Patescibacteria group bacterium]|nr:hypothetical protein [Patescibacteria group bacterium]
MKLPREHNQIKLCVSGAAETAYCGINAFEKGKALGREIVRQGAIIVTGATTGFPMWSAIGAKEMDGLSIGFSPGSSEREHIEVYNLPVDFMDVIIYTGFGYPGRDLILTRSSDAVLFGCGRMGTIHEFTIAFEDEKPVGILEDVGSTDKVIKMILDNAHRGGKDRIIFDSDPKALVERVLELVERDQVHRAQAYLKKAELSPILPVQPGWHN